MTGLKESQSHDNVPRNKQKHIPRSSVCCKPLSALEVNTAL